MQKVFAYFGKKKRPSIKGEELISKRLKTIKKNLPKDVSPQIRKDLSKAIEVVKKARNSMPKKVNRPKTKKPGLRTRPHIY